MPPRYAYWTIIAGGLPTAFRAADRDELLPTFQRIKERHPDAQMKYFARGKLWESQDAARAAQTRGGARNRGGERHARPGEAGGERERRPGARPDEAGRERDRRPAARPDEASRERDRRPGARPDEAGRERERRSRDWRPGGDHRDPRQKFIDAKKQRNAVIRQERWQRKNAEGAKGQVSGVRHGQGNSREGNRTGGKRFEAKSPEAKSPEGRRPEGKRPEGNQPDWKKPDWKKRPEARGRPAGKKPWMQKPWTRSQGTEEPKPPPRPQGPNREPRPDEEPKPTPPPKPEQPITPAPGPPERGLSRRPFRPAGKYPKGPRKG
jgi:hypothetical protein